MKAKLKGTHHEFPLSPKDLKNGEIGVDREGDIYIGTHRNVVMLSARGGQTLEWTRDERCDLYCRRLEPGETVVITQE